MATKKITELPFIVTVSGSSVFDNPSVNSVVPVVLYGTTNQITVENFSKFTNLYAAQTGSQNIFTQNQWFNTTVSASTINVGTLGVGGNTTIAGTLGVTGNSTIGGNLAVAGRITAEEFYTEITTASVIYASGSTKFGDDTGDKHEFTGSINVSGSIIYNGVILTNIDANTIQRLQQATASIQQATASLNTFTASQDDRNFILSQVTGSFAGEIGGLEAYTASLKTAAIVSSSTQILNYNIFATTGSNTFRANQAITGSLSVSAGEFNVTTGSGNMTSSLIFDHTQNDGVTLGLRHNDRLSVADHTFNVNVWAAGVYTSFVRNGVPYSILNVEAFDDNKIYLYRDTRLYNKSLVIDNNLTVQNGVVIGSGSLLVNGVITGSILATNGVVSSSNQLFELNQFTASQDGRNFTLSQVTGSLIGITNGLMAFTAALDNTYATDAQLYQLYQSTRSLELHSGSMIGVTNGLMAYTASNTSLNTGLRGEIDGIEAYTASLKGQAIVSSSTQVQNYDVFALNSNLYTSTGSLIGITNGLMAFTAALDSTYATDAQLYQLYQATRSIELTTGSLIGITNGLMAFTASLDNTFATDAQLYQLYQSTRSIELTTGSLIGITNGLMAFTAALDSTYATDAQLYQLYAETASIKAEIGGIELYTASLKAASIVSSSTQVQNYDVFALNSNLYNGTGSIKGEIAGIEAYTASLKGAAIVSSSQQIQNYFTFAQTSSANTFYGNQTVLGTLDMATASIANASFVESATFFDIDTLAGKKLRLNKSGNQIIMGTAAPVLVGSVTEDGTSNPLQVTGNQSITSGDLVFRTAGKGIDFSATSNGSGTTSSELLNDYEEGTWTPTFTASTSGTITVNTTAGYSEARYTKIGRQVTVSGTFTVLSVSSPVGEWRIQGLPFTSEAGAGKRSAVSVFADALETTATTSIVGYVDPSVTYITLYKYAAGAVSNMAADVKAGSYVFLTATYNV
jgi:hypothetical protein